MNAHNLTAGIFVSFVRIKYDALICINKKKLLSGQSKNANGHIKYSSTSHRQNLGNLQFFNNHDHHTHSHCLIYFGSVFENYSSLFLSMCVPAEIYLNYTCYRCCKGDASTRYIARLSSGAKLMASQKPSMYKISNFCIMPKKKLLKFALLNLLVTIYNLQPQLLLEHEVNNSFSVNKSNFTYSTVINSKHHTYILL